MIPRLGLICISPMANDKQHFSFFYFPPVSFVVEMSFAHGLIGVFIFCLFVYYC